MNLISKRLVGLGLIVMVSLNVLPLRSVLADPIEVKPDLTIPIKLDPSILQLNKKLSLAWEYDLKQIGWSEPAVGSDGTVYMGTEYKYLTAINLEGTNRWNYNAGGEIIAISVDDTQTIYAATLKELHAINPDGTGKWIFKIDNGDPHSNFRTAPAFGPDGTIYTVFHGGSIDQLVALESDKTLKWSYRLKDSLGFENVMVGSDGTIYMNSDTKLLALKPNGTKKWEFEANKDILASPTLGPKGTIYFASDNELYAISPDGSKQWSTTFSESTYASPVVGSNGTIYISSAKRNLYAVNPDGSLKWTLPEKGYVFKSGATDSTGMIYSHTGSRYLYAINPNKSVKYTYDLGDNLVSTPLIGLNDSVYVKDTKGILHALGNYTVSTVSLSPTTLNLNKGDNSTLIADVSPRSALNKKVHWQSSNPTVAAVDNVGKVTGLTPGTAKISVQTDDGGFIAECTVTVKEATVSSPSFIDTAGNWAASAIIEGAKKEIVRGYPDGTFRPDANVTRAEFTVMLIKGIKAAEVSKALTFKDISNIGSWAAPSVAAAVNLGFIKGYPDNTFRPNDNITHAEMASMVIRASGLILETKPTSGYEDDSRIPDWVRAAATTAEQNGIIIVGGIPQHIFDSNGFATRSEAISAILSMLKVKK
ncbi:S-layer homology domain-containing protein [Paenibacillus albiflavus]|uniref:S-layer homology domain-containing protein n=1 Tax=Paenibacillus albiflavus TaxID=2545760 RepID=UPI001404291D|nr:S-layer homology domain-containing protein [Paenibacillus albiflavus]